MNARARRLPAPAVPTAPAPRLVTMTRSARDYEIDREVIRCVDGLRFVLREQVRDEHGTRRFVLYTAWEPAEVGAYLVTQTAPGGKLWGRADSATWDGRPVRFYGATWTGDVAPIYWVLQQAHRARELIRATCPETVDGYDRPDGISLAFLRAPSGAVSKVDHQPWEDGR